MWISLLMAVLAHGDKELAQRLLRRDDVLTAIEFRQQVDARSLGWSRERAAEFMRENTLLSETEISTETLRYSTLPHRNCGTSSSTSSACINSPTPSMSDDWRPWKTMSTARIR